MTTKVLEPNQVSNLPSNIFNGDKQYVRIGTINDQYSFYHAISKAFFKEYQLGYILDSNFNKKSIDRVKYAKYLSDVSIDDIAVKLGVNIHIVDINNGIKLLRDTTSEQNIILFDIKGHYEVIALIINNKNVTNIHNRDFKPIKRNCKGTYMFLNNEK